MSARRKKRSQASALHEIKKENLKPTEQPPTEHVVKIDPKEAILKDVLNSITTSFELNKSFAKLTFNNSSSYCGWLSPNGFHGFGNYKFADGATFRGSFQESLTKGMGRYIYTNGNIYEGQFLAGRRHGYGTYKTKRFQYDGYFKDNMFHGQGVWKSKKKQQKGIFQEGQIIYGESRDSSGIFTGSFESMGSRKQGKLVFLNSSSTYDGSWNDDLFSGFGVYNWNDERSNCTRDATEYVGYWLDGKRHGLGKLTFQQRCIICQWNYNRKVSAGLLIACNGSVYAGTEMYSDNNYQGSYLIKVCDESRTILSEIVNLLAPDNPCELVVEIFIDKIKELVTKYSDWFSKLNPIRIPHYEITTLPAGPNNTCLELRYLQQVITENYNDFNDLYKKYTHPEDDCMNNFGLNLFYMDVLQKIQDVNIAEQLKKNSAAICEQKMYACKTSGSHPLMSVVFHEFIHHFLYITELLMTNENLKMAAEGLRPTFFGVIAAEVLFMLRMLRTYEVPEFLVREGILLNRPAILNLLQSIEEHCSGEKTLRTAYKFLQMKKAVSGESLNYIQAVGKYFENALEDGVLYETEREISSLELIEIVLYTCQLKLAREEMRKHQRQTYSHMWRIKKSENK